MQSEKVASFLNTINSPLQRGKAWKVLNELQSFNEKVDGQFIVSRWRWAEKYYPLLKIEGKKIIMPDNSYYDDLPKTVINYICFLQEEN